MRRYTHFIIILTLLFFTIPATYAQETMQLSVAQAIETGLKNNKSLKLSQSKVQYSIARLNEMDAMRYPWLKFSASYTRLSEVDPFNIVTPFGTFEIAPSILNNYSTKLSLIQPLFTGNKISSAVEAAEYTLNSVNADLQKDKDELALTIKTGYWNLYKALELKKVIDKTVIQVEAHLKDAKNMLAQGMLTKNDVLKLEVQFYDVLYKQSDMNNAVRLSTIALNNTLGIPLNTKLELTDTNPDVNSIVADLEEYLEKAYSNRPEIKSADYKVKAGESGVTAAKSGWYPQITFMGNYTYARPNQRIVPSKDEFNGTWDVSIGVSFDIWNWNTTSHQTEQALAQYQQAKDGLEILRDAITLEVTQNYLIAIQAKEKIQISKLAAQQAEENFRITGEKFKQGLALSSDLIDAEVAYIQAQTNYQNAVVDAEIAKAKLYRSIGQ